ncbi:MAG: cellulase family glycosylhydrolase [Spirochaetales bacterium]|nr:cellulase family glycosylhydrolase [Spirochaetales bacterium]
MVTGKFFNGCLLGLIILTLYLAAPLHAQTMGDANNSGVIDIVDALVIAQQYVGLHPNPFNSEAADVNCNGTIDIVDALLVAQYYVGLISGFPCTSPTPVSGVGRTAGEIASQMKIGWNIGNTLEAICGENAWGNPNITASFINTVKSAGFNAIRLPVAWDCHSSNQIIDAAWLSRVRQVVDYCMNAGMFVVMNIHWDNGWLENNVTTSAQAAVNEKQHAYWTQIANTFKSYDDRLLFASANEPNVDDATGMSVLLSYHQTFVNAVRATGGNNSSRVLVIQGPSTDIEKSNNLMNTLPTDQIADRLIVEVHYYTPYQFCLMTEDADWGKMFYYWGNGYHSTTETSRNATWGEENDVERYFGYMKSKFVDKGIPVIIGEFLAIQRTNPADLALHLNSRDYYHRYVVNSAKNKGMIIFFWDTGGVINRNTGAIIDQRTINALQQGIGG